MKSPDPYSRRSFIHEGRRLVYEVHGEGEHLLVYLNALLLDANLNRPMAQALAARGNRVVLLDLLGHGLSDKPAQAYEHRIDLYAEEVIALLDHLGADDAVLGGISLGANVSLLAATQDPARVRGLILEMPVMEQAVPSVALTFVPFLLGLYYARLPFRFLTALVRRVPRGTFPPLDSILNAASLPPDQMAAVLHGVLLGPTTPTLGQREAIAAPTIVIGHGADLIHPFSDAEAIVRQLQNARLVRASSILELRLRPARLTAEIAGFLDEVWRPGSVSAMSA
ncbi:MAG TPA: alpha/beta fold hydrolase [Acidimicrobiales bacterium]|nr:alpha/beta fold hydrolase [Acidimicrobiales bacterium]